MYTEHINKYYAVIEGQLELWKNLASSPGHTHFSNIEKWVGPGEEARKNLFLAFDSSGCHSSLVSGYVYGTFMGQLIIS